MRRRAGAVAHAELAVLVHQQRGRSGIPFVVERCSLRSGQIVGPRGMRRQYRQPDHALLRGPALKRLHVAALVVGSDERTGWAGPLENDDLAAEVAQLPHLSAGIDNGEVRSRLPDRCGGSGAGRWPGGYERSGTNRCTGGSGKCEEMTATEGHDVFSLSYALEIGVYDAEAAVTGVMASTTIEGVSIWGSTTGSIWPGG
ncbi:hypothetical protein MESS2_560039 [Mesorhizobium metallidurans STM 2683]|uniref:Uncharacterized protein n=1 Tax=Mesorhizobium metallidurans STM 2683 TaxID=1297569 RepID=M5F6C2_9HYPH|nr:hypothetical protein MESS2_560039 [Mesorhizobium metallidurans STM 2683]